ncbi:hypothetical protein ALC56_10033 [Trachymyrmex septentrionalis]|uniref:Uncharacterized protein n=1 Tax=Trachymyrmex septentrionalis TaxID=34720 RepID=A0A195F506_9HYME|nr:hypothetical protein ALC56_10033 [Trachymyrmex septentrionalis]
MQRLVSLSRIPEQVCIGGRSSGETQVQTRRISSPMTIFQWTTVKLLGPIFMDVVGPLMATTESSKKAGTNFLNKYLAVRIVWCDYGAGKVYRFLNSMAPMEMVQTYVCTNIEFPMTQFNYCIKT